MIETRLIRQSDSLLKILPLTIMPELPRHSQAKNTKNRRVRVTRKTGKAWSGLKPEDLEGLDEKIREKFQWTHSPRDFQLEAIKAQLLRKDVLIHAGTGSGKTTIAAGPHALIDKSKGMVTFLVSPLLALQEEQVSLYIVPKKGTYLLLRS
jgi:ATP-dependent helicase YprA (DUF1998 family)